MNEYVVYDEFLEESVCEGFAADAAVREAAYARLGLRPDVIYLTEHVGDWYGQIVGRKAMPMAGFVGVGKSLRHEGQAVVILNPLMAGSGYDPQLVNSVLFHELGHLANDVDYSASDADWLMHTSLILLDEYFAERRALDCFDALYPDKSRTIARYFEVKVRTVVGLLKSDFAARVFAGDTALAKRIPGGRSMMPNHLYILRNLVDLQPFCDHLPRLGLDAAALAPSPVCRLFEALRGAWDADRWDLTRTIGLLREAVLATGGDEADMARYQEAHLALRR
jgi:hypothetical protein